MEMREITMIIIIFGVLSFVLVPIVLLYHNLAPEREANLKTLEKW